MSRFPAIKSMAAADANLSKAGHRTRLADSIVTQRAVKAFYGYAQDWEWHLSTWNVGEGPGCAPLPRPVKNDGQELHFLFDPDRSDERHITSTRGRLTPHDQHANFGNFQRTELP